MKILVVDDEARHRRGMLSLIRTLRPEYEVLVAKNGIDALDIVDTLQPDIVLTDIRMPIMDGLAFLERLNEAKTKRRPRVVFLSAYNLFEYAQTALRHGAYDYLLKPVDIEKVEGILRRIEEEMMLETWHHLESDRASHIRAWLNGAVFPHDWKDYTGKEIAAEAGFIVYTEYIPIEAAGIDGLGRALLEDLNKVWSQVGSTFTILGASTADSISVITFIFHAKHASWNRTEIRQRLELIAQKSDYADGRLVHGIGSPFDLLEDGGLASYREAKAAQQYTFYDKWNGIVFYDERIQREAPEPALDSEYLFAEVCAGNVKHAVALCRQSFEQLADEGWTPPARVKEFASLILMKLKSRCRELLDDALSSRLTEAALVGFQACESDYAIMVLLEAQLVELSQYLQGMKRGRGEFVIESCLKLIHEYYQEDLTLEKVARRYYFNPSYFSTLFKNYTGRTFTDYLTDTRMNQAKALLSDPDAIHKVYDIAELCGYRDAKYFNRMFKKLTGVTPETYRYKAIGSTRV
jgi:two-component system response regulator YesN